MWVISVGLVLALAAEQVKTQEGLGEEVERVTKWARNETEKSEPSLDPFPLLFISSASPSSPLVLSPLPSLTSVQSTYFFENALWEQGKWTLKVEEVKVGRGEMREEKGEIRLDWDRDGLWGPESAIKSLHNRILHHRRCTKTPESATFTCDCGPQMPITMYPTLYFRLSTITVEIRPEIYMKREGIDKCLVLLSPQNETYWTFGAPFFRQYSTILSPESLKIGLALRPTAYVGNWGAIVGTAVGLVAAAGLGKRWRSSRKEGLLLEYDYLGLRIR